MTLTVMDWFCGAGGSSQGIDAVPGVEVARAANHWQLALDSHASNFPHVDHQIGDIRDLPVQNWPVHPLFWASPECKHWTGASGKKATYRDPDAIPGLDDRKPDEAAERSRALMWDIPKYLEGVQRRGKLVLAGVVENVVEARRGKDWNRWLGDIRNLGYRTRLIALNSMHAQGTKSLAAPQSRDRLYLAYWHKSLNRNPDWDKWLRPLGHCPGCDETVPLVQAFKNPRKDMGKYRASYLYRCPRVSCRNTAVEPPVLSALTAIDLNVPAKRIGERPKTAKKPEGLAPNTMNRIRAGVRDYWLPLLVPTGGTWRDSVTPLTQPVPTRTTRENDGVALSPLMIPVEGREGKEASPATRPYRTQTGRNETGILLPPFVIPLRGGGDLERARPASVPLHTVSAEGNHHGLVPPLLVPYYTKGTPSPATDPVGALSTRDRYALAEYAVDVADIPFRMLLPREIGRTMAFAADYIVLGIPREQVQQYGNAVTPCVAELIVSALVEAVSGEPLERRQVAKAA